MREEPAKRWLAVRFGLGSIAIRAAGGADYPAVARIQAASPGAAQWPVGDYSNFVVLVAVAGGVAAGFCAWRQTAEDEAELLNLAVMPEARQQGVGLALLEALRRVARGTLFLEVAEGNGAARALYRKAGWEVVAVRKEYYGPGNNAIVMKITSCYSPQ